MPSKNKLSLLLVAAILLCESCSSDSPVERDSSSDLTEAGADTTADGPRDVDDSGSDETDADAPTDLDVSADLLADLPDLTGLVLPDELPFEFTRPVVGAAPTPQEISDFTREITGFWRDTDFFRWIRMTSHGVDASNDQDWPHYALWWQDTQAIREGDDVIFRHYGRADNLTLRTCKVLTNAIAGYMLTGDEHMRWIVEEYSRGLAALAMGMQFDEDAPAPYLQARAIFTRDHNYDTVDGRHVIVDYDPVRRDEDAWNAAIVHNPDNPYWGDVWFVNQRSKDDVPHMYRALPMLLRAAQDAPDESVREAAELALEYLSGFAEDIVRSGYEIRTRYGDGEPVVPTLENGVSKDLASFVLFDAVLPNGECTGKFGSTLVAFGASLDHDCTDGDGGIYETVAATSHYFNYAIIRYFHISALHNALMFGYDDMALNLMQGLAARADRIVYDEDMPNRDEPVWMADAASFLLASAAAGLPLTGDEARLVHEQYSLSVSNYAAFTGWDPWVDDFPQGNFDYKPPRGVSVRITEMAYLLEYCFSPLRNPAGTEIVDCDIIGDIERWGETVE